MTEYLYTALLYDQLSHQVARNSGRKIDVMFSRHPGLDTGQAHSCSRPYTGYMPCLSCPKQEKPSQIRPSRTIHIQALPYSVKLSKVKTDKVKTDKAKTDKVKTDKAKTDKVKLCQAMPCPLSQARPCPALLSQVERGQDKSNQAITKQLSLGQVQPYL